VTELSFWNIDGKYLFSYKAPTFHGSPWQSSCYKWENDLLSLGCELIDPEEVIVNK
jgi:hypothetical protein